jgi:hypothetical protein
MRFALVFSLFLTGIGYASSWHGQSPKMELIVEGIQISRYYHQGTIYVEATKGKKYSIHISNPLGERVAVALSVDGLNTINAQHMEARLGAKWILGPYETIAIDGWQINSGQARRFFFTDEAKSYGAQLGRTENLGIISAAFFRERPQPAILRDDKPSASPVPLRGSAPEKSKGQDSAAGMKSEQYSERGAPQTALSEYAATGIGDRVGHKVQRVYLDLEERPFATIDLRYEFRPMLVRLGVIPPKITEDPLLRREKAKGFREDVFCPEP